VLQDALLFPLLDVRENLNFGSHRATGKMTLDSVVSLLEISHLLDRRARNLSGGERQRVALGRALLSEPDLLLLDEPFAPLDAPRRDRLVQMLGDIQAQWQLPIMLISHDPVDIKSLVEQIFLMDDGRIPGSKRLAQTGGRS
jgi:molybdate transport system ATP-binding protein